MKLWTGGGKSPRGVVHTSDDRTASNDVVETQGTRKAYAGLAFPGVNRTFLLLDQSCLSRANMHARATRHASGRPSSGSTTFLWRTPRSSTTPSPPQDGDRQHHETTLAHPGSTVNNVLFRSGAIHCNVLELTMMSFGREWLINSLGHLVQDVILDEAAVKSSHRQHPKSEKKSGGASPGFEHGGAHVKSKVNHNVLKSWCSKAWCDMWNARDLCSEYLRQICHITRSEVDNRFN